ncbi:LacI family DNA-binding transcriptional regulator [Aeromicrobium fastidiosum]|uniref:LacI family transcriptional regulator n=1 Tax=Aeromicrobium fastidiosum TaxID=52699 RepID=A0A641AU56_9ACTN|nr:LacI family DNA-binding transcriptional regulator [Aeromicrobium fastidiosum]KAA1380398.1 LacI family transcriptional regulator [Aeromicrobium fastidiosum]
MADVARMAGVSHQTVSRVINEMPNIRPETRAKVLEAISVLGYRPNRAARALVTRRSSTIGIISTETGLYGPNSIQRTVEESARQAGYFAGSVSLQTVTEDGLTGAIEHLLRQSVEGIVLIAAQYAALDLIGRQDFGVPFLVVDADVERADLAVGVDQHRGAYEATRHLLGLGHTRIAHVRGPVQWTEAEARRQGWEDAIREAGHEPGRLYLGDWTARSGYAAGRELLADRDSTAVFLANDQMSVGLLRAANEAGLVVPNDLSVVGFDDSPESEYLTPPLTTVRQNFHEVGRRAIAVLDAAITGRPDATPRVIEPEIILRSSTAALPRAGST